MGGGSSESSSGPVDMVPAEYKPLRSPISDAFRFGLQDIEDDVTSRYEGPFVAPITAAEQRLVNQVGAYGGAGLTENQMAAEAARGATIRGERLTPTEQFAPWARAINEAFREGTLQNVGQFTSMGHRVQDSSPFARAEAISDRARADALARVASDIYQTERGFQEQAALAEEQVPLQRAALDTTEIQNLVNRLSAAQLPRMIQDMGIERAMEEHQKYIDSLMQFFGLAATVTQPTIAQQGESGGWNMFI